MCVFDMGPVATALALSASVNPVQVGKPVVFTATVQPATADGTISFLDGSTLIGSAPILAGQASLSTSALPLGVHSIQAQYDGNSQYQASTASLTETVKATVTTTIALWDNAGHPLVGGRVQYYSGAWQTLGVTGSDGTVVAELPPGNYSFSMDYAFGRQVKTQNIGGNPLVLFQTRQVSLQLVDSDATPLVGGKAQYYAGAWRNIGVTGSNGIVLVELLPANYTFSMDFAFGRVTKAQDIGVNASVLFQTLRVTVHLNDSFGNALAGAKVQYYGGAWRDVGFTASNGSISLELLSGNYTFSVDYAFTRGTQAQNVGVDSNVNFTTKHVVARLNDSAGGPLAGARTQYYAGAWRDIGVTDAGGAVAVELMAGSYAFSVDYAFGRTQKNQDIALGTPVTFQTGRVHSISGSCIQYYGGAWRSFVNDMELLPVAVTFRFNDGTPNTTQTLAAGVVNLIH